MICLVAGRAIRVVLNGDAGQFSQNAGDALLRLFIAKDQKKHVFIEVCRISRFVADLMK